MFCFSQKINVFQELKKFLDDAENGVIFFSLGTIVKSSALSTKKVEFIVKVFSELKQRVLWKWEDDSPPQVSKNLLISKWLPQAAILGEFNCFIIFDARVIRAPLKYHSNNYIYQFIAFELSERTDFLSKKYSHRYLNSLISLEFKPFLKYLYWNKSL